MMPQIYLEDNMKSYFSHEAFWENIVNMLCPKKNYALLDRQKT